MFLHQFKLEFIKPKNIPVSAFLSNLTSLFDDDVLLGIAKANEKFLQWIIQIVKDIVNVLVKLNKFMDNAENSQFYTLYYGQWPLSYYEPSNL